MTWSTNTNFHSILRKHKTNLIKNFKHLPQRTASIRLLKVDSALEAFKDSLSQWRTVYQNEKRSVMEIARLSKTCSQLLYQISNINAPYQVMMWLKDVEKFLDGIILNPINGSDFLPEQLVKCWLIELVLPFLMLCPVRLNFDNVFQRIFTPILTGPLCMQYSSG